MLMQLSLDDTSQLHYLQWLVVRIHASLEVLFSYLKLELIYIMVVA